MKRTVFPSLVRTVFFVLNGRLFLLDPLLFFLSKEQKKRNSHTRKTKETQNFRKYIFQG